MRIILISFVLALIGCTKKGAHNQSRMPSSDCIQPSISCFPYSKCSPETALSFSRLNLKAQPYSRTLKDILQVEHTVTHLVVKREPQGDYYFVKPGMQTSEGGGLKGWTDANKDGVIQETEITHADFPVASMASITNLVTAYDYHAIDQHGNAYSELVQYGGDQPFVTYTYRGATCSGAGGGAGDGGSDFSGGGDGGADKAADE